MRACPQPNGGQAATDLRKTGDSGVPGSDEDMSMNLARSLRILLPALVAALALAHAGEAHAAGGRYRFDGGTAYQRSQVRGALAASSFKWNRVRATVTIYIEAGVMSHSTRGEIWLDADLLDSGRFAWATVQDEYAHQVDFFLLTPQMRATLQSALGAKAWCYENDAVQDHSDQGCERFTSMVPWAYWRSKDNAYEAGRVSSDGPGEIPGSARSPPSALDPTVSRVRRLWRCSQGPR
jgi:hypothetical protein